MSKRWFYTNERRMVEATILQLALITVVGDHFKNDLGKNPLDHPLVKELTEVGGSIIPPMTPKDSRRVFNRVMPAKNLFLAACDAQGDAGYQKQGLATVFFINNMIAQEAFFFEDGGAYDLALQKVLPIMQDAYDNPSLRRSAFKGARRQLAVMKSHQYFTDIQWGYISV